MAVKKFPGEMAAVALSRREKHDLGGVLMHGTQDNVCSCAAGVWLETADSALSAGMRSPCAPVGSVGAASPRWMPTVPGRGSTVGPAVMTRP